MRTIANALLEMLAWRPARFGIDLCSHKCSSNSNFKTKNNWYISQVSFGVLKHRTAQVEWLYSVASAFGFLLCLLQGVAEYPAIGKVLDPPSHWSACHSG
jgi:hypothetical protein